MRVILKPKDTCTSVRRSCLSNQRMAQAERGGIVSAGYILKPKGFYASVHRSCFSNQRMAQARTRAHRKCGIFYILKPKGSYTSALHKSKPLQV